MPYETLKELSKRGKKFIVLGTDGTKKGKVYKKFNAEFQMEEIETDQKNSRKNNGNHLQNKRNKHDKK